MKNTKQHKKAWGWMSPLLLMLLFFFSANSVFGQGLKNNGATIVVKYDSNRPAEVVNIVIDGDQNFDADASGDADGGLYNSGEIIIEKGVITLDGNWENHGQIWLDNTEVYFIGGGQQQILGTATHTFQWVEMAKTDGRVYLGADVEIWGTLNMNGVYFSMEDNNLLIKDGAVVNQGGIIQPSVDAFGDDNMFAPEGLGELRMEINTATADQSILFPVGDVGSLPTIGYAAKGIDAISQYSPAVVDFTSLEDVGPKYVGVRLENQPHPENCLDADKTTYLNRYWAVKTEPGFGDFNAEVGFQYRTEDIAGVIGEESSMFGAATGLVWRDMGKANQTGLHTIDTAFVMPLTEPEFTAQYTAYTAMNKRPAPHYTIDYCAEATNEVVLTTIEWDTDPTFTNSTLGSGSAVTLTPGVDMYFRYAADECNIPGHIFYLYVKPRPPQPNGQLDYVSEKIDDITPNKDYIYAASVNNGLTFGMPNYEPYFITYAIPEADDPPLDLQLRVDCSDTNFVSLVQIITLEPRPDTPTGINVDYTYERITGLDASLQTKTPVSLKFKQFLNPDGNDYLSITELIPEFNEGDAWTIVRVAPTATSFASRNLEIIIPERPETPFFDIDYIEEETVQRVDDIIEYNTDNEFLATPNIDGPNGPVTVNPGDTYYFRVAPKPNDQEFASRVFPVELPDRPATPMYDIDYLAETTLTPVVTTDQYTFDQAHNGQAFDEWITPATDQLIDLTPGENMFIRVAPVQGVSFKSETQTLVVGPRPASPVHNVDFVNETTLNPILVGQEYTTDDQFEVDIKPGEGEVVDLTPGEDLYIRIAAVEAATFASDPFTLTVPARPILDQHTINYTTEFTGEPVETYEEYTYEADEFTAVYTAGSGSAMLLEPGKDIYFRIAAVPNANFTSVRQLLHVASRPGTPVVSVSDPNDADALLVKSSNGTGPVALESDRFEYWSSLLGDTWNDWLDGSTVSTEGHMELYVRVKASATSFASAPTQNRDYPVAPEGADGLTVTNEDTELTFDPTDFDFSDDDGDTFDGIIIISKIGNGELLYDELPVELDTEYSDVTLLTFMPDLNDNGEANATFRFKVKDSDGMLSEDYYDMTINVTPDNDVPTISGSPDLTVDENADYLFIPVSNDVEGDELEFAIQNKPEWADFDVTTGALSGHPVDGQEGTYDDIIITVTDNIDAPEALPTFSIEVINTNDGPVMTGTPELTAMEDELYEFTPDVVDNDGDVLEFSISFSDVEPESYTFNTATGVLSFTPANDHVGLIYGEIVITVEDDYLSDELPPFSIEVINANDAPTEIVLSKLDIDENVAIDTWVADLEAIDVDVDDVHTFDIVDSDGTFSITGSELKTNTTLDFEKQESYEVSIHTDDGNGGELTSVFTIAINNLNDNTPLFGADSYEFAINENSDNGTVVATMVATDEDGDLNELTYSIVESSEFAIASIDDEGVIAVANSAALDKEADINEFNIVVEVSDGTNSSTVPVLITLIDMNEYPPVLNADTDDFYENDGSYIYTLTGSDEDEDAIISYSIREGDEIGAFTVVGSEIQLVSSTGLNYEALDETTFNLLVDISDGEYTATNTITLNLLDVNEFPPVFANIEQPLEENTPDGVVVVDLGATDGDGNASLEYEFLSGNEAGAFIVQGSDLVVANSLELNFEKVHSFELGMRVSDGDYTATATVTVNLQNLNDVAPLFASDEITIFENTETLTAVYTLSASDEDGDIVTFTIDENDAFELVGDVIQVKDVAELDFEETESFDVMAHAFDGIHTTDATITINLENLNDNAPVLTVDVLGQVDENSDNGYVVANLTAEDEDGDLTTLTYTYDGDAAFEIVDNTLVVADSEVLNFEEVESFEITITLSDEDATHDDSETVTINIVNLNDVDPELTSELTFVVPENTVGETGYTLTAYDEDELDEVFTYTLAANDYFVLSASGDKIEVIDGVVLDYEGVQSIDLDVTISDGERTTDVELTVTVENLNDIAPILADDEISRTENSAIDEVLYTFVADDGDNDPDVLNVLIYEMISGDTDAFSVSTDGKLIVEGDLEFDDIPVYEIVVKVTDGDYEDEATLIVNLIENQAPVIVGGDRIVEMSEDSDPDAFELILQATDVDNTGADMHWKLDGLPQHGDVTLIGTQPSDEISINYVPDANYNGQDEFVISVSDGDITTSINVVVVIEAINDPPVITNSGEQSIREEEEETFFVLFEDPDFEDEHTFTVEIEESMSDMVLLDINAENFAYTVKPIKDFSGHVNVTLTVSDKAGATNEFTYILYVIDVPDAPVVVNITDFDLVQDQEQMVELIFSDPDLNDDHTYSLSSSDPRVSIPKDRIEEIDNGWRYYIVPDKCFVGEVEISVVVYDKGPDSRSDKDTYLVTYENVNDAPVLDFILDQTMDEDTYLPMTITFSECDADDIVTVDVVSNNEKVEILNATTSTQDSRHNFTILPDNDYFGFADITVTLTDNHDATDNQTFALEIFDVNDPPVVTPGVDVPDLKVETNLDTYTYVIPSSIFTEPDGGSLPLTWSVSGLPDGWSFDPATRTISSGEVVLIPGIYPIKVTVTDESGATATQKFIMIVQHPTGIGELDAYAMAIYPNPSDGHFKLQVIGDESHDLTVRVYDAIGQVIWNKEYYNVTDMSEIIDLSQHAKGSYYMEISSGESVRYQKLIISE